MEIIEYKTEGKSMDKQLCEDEMVITDRFVAVIDGVTSKSDFHYKGKSTGKLAAGFVKEVLTEAPAEAGIEDIMAGCGRKWEEFYREVSFPYERKSMGPQAVAVIYSAFYRTIWLIGDCQAMVDGTRYTVPKKSDEVLSEFRSLVIHITKDPAEARRLIQPWIVKASKFSNDTASCYGYAVINGEEIPRELIQTIPLDKNSHEIVLASDGYPVLMPSLEESEEELARILEKDPDCCDEYRSTKGIIPGNVSFDDRTYIKFTI